MPKFTIAAESLRYMEPETARQTAAAILEKLGVPAEDAQEIARNLNMADLRGVDTHGIRTLPIYAKRFENGGLNPRPQMKLVRESASSAVLDGDNGIGHIVGYRAMKLAMEKARKTGVGIVFVRNSNHFGPAAYYSMMAQEEGMVGISMANAQARMAPTGGITPCYGTNPWSVSFPYGKDSLPVTLDMANCVVANSNILMARDLGVKIPFGWAQTAEGEATDDPNLAVLPLPFGGYKGYALAVAVELLAGIISGAAYGPEVGPYTSETKGQNVGQMFMAIDLAKIIDPESYEERYRDFTESLLHSKLAKGCDRVFLPGEKEYDNRKEREVNGIPIDKKYVEQINALCRRLNLDMELKTK